MIRILVLKSRRGGMDRAGPASNGRDGAPWVVVSHDMSNSRKADAAASASPWRFIFQIKGVQGLPQGINQVAVFWKTRFAQARVRFAVGSASSGLRFEKGCLSVDTTFLEDPLLSDGQPVRDKMLIFSVKGYRGGEEDEGGLRIGSFSFRCLQAMAQTPVG